MSSISFPYVSYSFTQYECTNAIVYIVLLFPFFCFFWTPETSEKNRAI